jgi:hypothetical protein
MVSIWSGTIMGIGKIENNVSKLVLFFGLKNDSNDLRLAVPSKTHQSPCPPHH